MSSETLPKVEEDLWMDLISDWLSGWLHIIGVGLAGGLGILRVLVVFRRSRTDIEKVRPMSMLEVTQVIFELRQEAKEYKQERDQILLENSGFREEIADLKLTCRTTIAVYVKEIQEIQAVVNELRYGAASTQTSPSDAAYSVDIG